MEPKQALLMGLGSVLIYTYSDQFEAPKVVDKYGGRSPFHIVGAGALEGSQRSTLEVFQVLRECTLGRASVN